MRKITLSEGEYYHVFNRGVEKREIFSDAEDINRFLESIEKFNSTKTLGSLHENRTRTHRRRDDFGSLTPKTSKIEAEQQLLVEIVCYCLNPNHFHLLLKQVHTTGIQKYMQRIGTGYTNYFNEKNERSGALFQGTYKAVHIDSNEQLLHTSVYVNLNNQFGSLAPNLSRSSWREYMGDITPFGKTPLQPGISFCKKDICKVPLSSDIDSSSRVNSSSSMRKSKLGWRHAQC